MGKILYVDDNEVNRDLLSRRLRRNGFNVLLAADGPSGVTAAQRERPDLILMDIDLGRGKMDGWEATRHIKTDPATEAIPVIAVTAHSTAEGREKSFAAGCCGFEPKPVDFPRFLERIRGVLASRVTGTAAPRAARL